jgi:hypothetical protein
VTDSIPPLDADVLAALRSSPPVPPEVRARAKARLLDSIATAGGAAAGGTRGIGQAGARRVAIAFLGGALVGGALHAAWMRPPGAKVIYVDRPAPPPPSVDLTPSRLPSSAPVPSSAPSAIPLPPSSAPTLRLSQLAAERAILDEARRALAQGDAGQALDRLERHRRMFSSPQLAEERDAMWIQALIKADRREEARARGEAFRKRYPDSLFSSAVDSALE